jgi:hypothetical protein
MKKLYSLSVFALTMALLALPAMAMAPATTNDVPNVGTDYLSPADVHAEIAAGNVAIIYGNASHGFFTNIYSQPGGVLGGNVEHFNSVLTFELVGTGPLKGWSRTLSLPAKSETHTGPRKLDADVDSFETLMYRIEGEIKGDKDFESFSIVAGTGNGLDSPGHTTVYRQKDGTYLIDSNFNIKYIGSFKGAKGSKLDGLEDTFEGVITMVAVPRGTKHEDVKFSK